MNSLFGGNYLAACLVAVVASVIIYSLSQENLKRAYEELEPRQLATLLVAFSFLISAAVCLGLAATLGCNERTDNPASTSNGELQDKVDGNADVIVVGAGTTGASMATALARQGKKVILLERSLDLPDRIVGELMQPGGVRALQQLGLENCAMTDACDSVPVKGYVVINPEVKGKEGKKGNYGHLREALLKYPSRDPEGFLEMFGFCSNMDGGSTSKGGTSKAQSPPQGYGFHNHLFVRELRKAAMAEPNVELVETTVSKLLEKEEVTRKRIFGVKCSNGKQYAAPLTVIADGIWSGLRTVSNNHKPHLVSSFIGMIVTHPPMESPVPHHDFGHVVLATPSPILIYQISPTETRVLVDCMGKVPSSTGELAKFLRGRSRFLPSCFQKGYLEAVEKGEIKSTPNRALAYGDAKHVPGCVLMGDALNMRHPLTGGGMTVALKDVVLLSSLLSQFREIGSDLHAIDNAVKKFYKQRKPYAASINVLATALYGVFSTPEGEDEDTRADLRGACLEYLASGGALTAGPVGLLSGLTPSPQVLIIHFFMVALNGVRSKLLPFGWLSPRKLIMMHRIMHVACIIIMPLLIVEQATPLSMWPVRKLVHLFFPFERFMWK